MRVGVGVGVRCGEGKGNGYVVRGRRNFLFVPRCHFGGEGRVSLMGRSVLWRREKRAGIRVASMRADRLDSGRSAQKRVGTREGSVDAGWKYGVGEPTCGGTGVVDLGCLCGIPFLMPYLGGVWMCGGGIWRFAALN
jgi:hypothetical protein